MTSRVSRRRLLAGFAGAPLAAALPGMAFALNTNEARVLVDKVVDEINRVINSGNSEGAMLVEFERIFARYADVAIIARSALGVAARSASNAQMRAFTKAFQGYIARKYGRRFREFAGGRLEVKSARPVKSFFEVKSTVHLPRSAPFEVTFLVSDKSGRDRFFNLFIEGVNMLASERTEIGAMLDKRRGNLDQLIKDLERAG